jgi:hypothetical protein
VNPVILFAGALVAPLLPVLAQVWRGPAFARILAPALGLGAGAGVLGAGFLLAAGRDALRLLYDGCEAAKFSAGPFDAAPALYCLGVVFAAVCVGAVATTALLCADGERQLRTLAFLALLLNAAVFGIALPHLGRVAAAAGLLAAEALMACGALLLLRRRTGPLRATSIGAGAAPMLIVAAAMLALPAGLSPAVRLACAAGLAAAGLAWMVGFGPGRRLRQALREISA